MSGDEAQTLADILAKVGGSPTFSRRGDAENISNALSDAGVKWARPCAADITGGITFSDTYPF